MLSTNSSEVVDRIYDAGELNRITFTAMCLWEARLEASNFDLWNALNKVQSEIGACETRDRFISIAEMIEDFCSKNPTIYDMLTDVGSWDWEVCPALLNQLVADWPEFPAINNNQITKSIIRVAGTMQ